jgi:hypothetical protein
MRLFREPLTTHGIVLISDKCTLVLIGTNQSSHSASSSIFSVYAEVRVSSILRTASIVALERSISRSSCSLVRSGCGSQ